MRIQHIRNATLLIEADERRVLVDPMLGETGTLPSFSYFRYANRRNPIVPLVDTVREPGFFEGVTHCLITHRHPDHLDPVAIDWLREHSIPVYCAEHDRKALEKKELYVEGAFPYGKRSKFLGGHIEGIPAQHGYGFIAGPMGPVMGFLIEWPGHPTLYLASDTIITPVVEKVLTERKPDVAVMAAGGARLDVFAPLLMRLEDCLRFVERAPGRVLANHMEALNHCPTTRADLKRALEAKGLEGKVDIPEDGDILEYP